jgi:hypothetical protein
MTPPTEATQPAPTRTRPVQPQRSECQLEQGCVLTAPPSTERRQVAEAAVHDIVRQYGRKIGALSR